jgi:PiT family inorganic phosphate transporter
MLTAIVLIIALALVFDFINGFHDAANSIATVVSTRVLSPRVAVVWAAFFNFIAFLFFGLHVAGTIGKGIIRPEDATMTVVAAALASAVVWNLITWYFGIPSSSSHALIGGMAGAGVAHAGMGTLGWKGITKVLVSIVASPVMGMILGFLLMVAVFWIFRKFSPARVDRWFRKGQLLSAALYSLGHGGNDAQKTMGIIAVLVYTYRIQAAQTAGQVPPAFEVALWMVLACHAAMGLGTLFGGWRIVKTMGMKITKLKPVGGFCAETGGAITLFAATALGIPVSTTHTITGAIIGVGSTTKFSAIRWGVAGNIVMAWVLTIPVTVILAFGLYELLSFLHFA